jgi:hypothetical protein
MEMATFLQEEARNALAQPVDVRAQAPQNGSVGPDAFIRQCANSPLFLVRRELENGNESLTVHVGELVIDVPPRWRVVFEQLRSGKRLQIREMMEVTGAQNAEEKDLVLQVMQELIREGGVEADPAVTVEPSSASAQS